MKKLITLVIILTFASLSYASLADEIFKGALAYGKDYAKNMAVKKGIEVATKKMGLSGGYTLAKGFFVWKSGKPEVAKGVLRNFWYANSKKMGALNKLCNLNDNICKYTNLKDGEVNKFLTFLKSAKPTTKKYAGKRTSYRKVR